MATCDNVASHSEETGGEAGLKSVLYNRLNNNNNDNNNLSEEAVFDLVETNRLVVSPPIPPRDVQQVGLIIKIIIVIISFIIIISFVIIIDITILIIIIIFIIITYILKAKKFAESAFQWQKNLRKKCVNLDIKNFATKVCKSIKSLKMHHLKAKCKQIWHQQHYNQRFWAFLQDFSTLLDLYL